MASSDGSLFKFENIPSNETPPQLVRIKLARKMTLNRLCFEREIDISDLRFNEVNEYFKVNNLANGNLNSFLLREVDDKLAFLY